KLKDYEEVHIAEIQTMVENELMQGPYKALARSYIEYRHDRDISREKQSALTREIEGLIQESNADLLNENANKDGKVIPT
ncbi:ATP cone domain-containing protein, partial [Devosia neptuniae]